MSRADSHGWRRLIFNWTATGVWSRGPGMGSWGWDWPRAGTSGIVDPPDAAPTEFLEPEECEPILGSDTFPFSPLDGGSGKSDGRCR